MDLPATYPGADALLGSATPGAAPLADLPWWQVFHDAPLQELLTAALAHNHDLALAAARVDEARALIGLARSEHMPQVEGSLGLSRDLASRSVMPQSDRWSTGYAASIGASWRLDLWGRVRRGEEAAMADYLAGEAGRRAVVVALVADVADGYVRLRTADLLRAITERTIATRRSTLDLFEKRLGGGLSSRLEVARAAGDLAASEATLPLVEQAIALQEHRLCSWPAATRGPWSAARRWAQGLLPPVGAGRPAVSSCSTRRAAWVSRRAAAARGHRARRAWRRAECVPAPLAHGPLLGLSSPASWTRS